MCEVALISFSISVGQLHEQGLLVLEIPVARSLMPHGLMADDLPSVVAVQGIIGAKPGHRDRGQRLWFAPSFFNLKHPSMQDR